MTERSMAVGPEKFGGIQTSVSAVHLMLDGTEVISLATIGPIVQEARRMFEKGEWRKSSQNFNRAVVAFEQSAAQWRQKINEAIAFARRQSLTPLAERKKGRGGSIAEIAKLTAEKTRVDTQIAAASRLMHRLKLDLETLLVAQEGQAAQRDAEELRGDSQPPAADADSAASAGDRELVRRGLAREVELQVAIQEGVAKFKPRFPFGRLVLFADSGEIVRIGRASVRDVVYVQDPDSTTAERTIPLREFVRRVQAGGVWLLQRRAPRSDRAED